MRPGGSPNPWLQSPPWKHVDSVWSIPWPGMETDPAVVLQRQGLTALGGLKCGPCLWCGGDNPERGEQGQEGLMVCQGHGV